MDNFKVEIKTRNKMIEEYPISDMFYLRHTYSEFTFVFTQIRYARQGIFKREGVDYKGIVVGCDEGEVFFEGIKAEQFMFYFEPLLREMSQEYNSKKPNKKLIQLLRKGCYYCPHCDTSGKIDWIRKIQGQHIFMKLDRRDRDDLVTKNRDNQKQLKRLNDSVIINQPVIDNLLCEEVCEVCGGTGLFYPDNLHNKALNEYKRTSPIHDIIIPFCPWNGWQKKNRWVKRKTSDIYETVSIRVSSLEPPVPPKKFRIIKKSKSHMIYTY